MTTFIKNIFSSIPKDWNIVKFEKYIYFQEGPGLRKWQFAEKGIPFLNIRCINDNGTIDKSKTQFVNEEEKEKYAHFMLEENDTVLSSSGSVGKIAIIKKEYLPLMLNTSIIRLRSQNKEKILDNYMRHFINSNLFSQQYMQESQGSAQVNFGPTHLKKMYISLPPLEEQKKIADILSTVDKKIGFVEENINATEELKKGLMQKLLTEGIGHTEFKDSELGRIPESWEVNEFGKISDILDPHPSHRAPKEDSNGYPFVGIGDISENGIINLQSSRKVSIEDIKEQNSNISINENDIGFGRVATVGKVIKFRGDYSFPFALSPTMAVIKVKDIEYEYFYQYLTSTMTKKQFKIFTSGSTRISLGIQNLRKLLVLIPLLEEQKQIAEILSTVDNKLENLKEKKQYFEELKKGLMQKLLTGEVRV
jgi:type I restriction enzyme S subunit